MKSKREPHKMLQKSLRFWSHNIPSGYSVATLSRRMRQLGYRPSRRKCGYTLSDIYRVL